MSDFDRFSEFLRREARGYNEAPGVPVEVMWRGVEEGLGEGDGVAGAGPAIDVLGYNEAPSAPREKMWGRIEAAWGVGGVGGGGSPVGRAATPRQWPGRRRVAGWAAALAAAASLVLGIALGRDARETQPGEVGAEPTVATVTAEPTPPNDAEPSPPTPANEPEPPVITASVLPLPGTSVDQRAPAIPVEPEPQVLRFTEAALTEPTRALPGRPTFHRDREQIRFLGRAETLLTAFRTDQRTPLTERDLAAWGRELLIETRMHLDLEVSQTPVELALLEDLELLMLQISRLGSGATDVEWRLARESMEIKNALPRLRAATEADGL